MKHIFTLAIIILTATQSFATWSIIMIDPNTKEIGMAGASCTYSCYGIGEIVPSVGAIIVQAMSNNDARQKGLRMIMAEASPEEIIEALRDPLFDPERQQYAVITMKYVDKPQVYTGKSTNSFNGAVTDHGVSVQGNTLANEGALHAVMSAVQEGRKSGLPIADILMNALVAGSDAGGDKRCGDQKATSAFIIVAKPGDRKPYLDLQIFGQGRGKQNAVLMLKTKLEKWKIRTTQKIK